MKHLIRQQTQVQIYYYILTISVLKRFRGRSAKAE